MPKISFSSFLDQLALASHGLFLLATKTPYRRSFWLAFVLLFLFFGTLLGLLSNGLSSFRLLFSGNLSLATSVLSSAFWGIFGIGKALPDWALNFALTLLQSILLSLALFLVCQSRPDSKDAKTASSGLESSALVTGLVVLGSGCPTCGTTLLAPLLTTVASGASGSLALAGRLSLILNLLAFLLGVFAFRRLGLITYATIKSRQSKKRSKS